MERSSHHVRLSVAVRRSVFGDRQPAFVATAPHSLISTSSTGSFANSPKFKNEAEPALGLSIGTSSTEALLTCASLIPATLRWRRTATKSRQRSERFWSLQDTPHRGG